MSALKFSAFLLRFIFFFSFSLFLSSFSLSLFHSIFLSFFVMPRDGRVIFRALPRRRNRETGNGKDKKKQTKQTKQIPDPAEN